MYSEKELTELLNNVFSSGEYDYVFKAPEDPVEYQKFMETLLALEKKGVCIILSDPYTQEEYIEVEKIPSCCVPKCILSTEE